MCMHLIYILFFVFHLFSENLIVCFSCKLCLTRYRGGRWHFKGFICTVSFCVVCGYQSYWTKDLPSYWIYNQYCSATVALGRRNMSGYWRQSTIRDFAFHISIYNTLQFHMPPPNGAITLHIFPHMSWVRFFRFYFLIMERSTTKRPL